MVYPLQVIKTLSSQMEAVSSITGKCIIHREVYSHRFPNSNCYIQGAVDYIYGSASAWFGECTLASNGGGAITANSRNSTTDPSYYVIDSSTITSAPGAPSLVGDVYLGRSETFYS
jgi:pectin methylesterase-like acyl-CoA thioesterase